MRKRNVLPALFGFFLAAVAVPTFAQDDEIRWLDNYRETIQEWQEIGHRGAVAHQLECFAFIAKAQEEGERAVRLMSAAEALREASNSPRTPQEGIEYERELAGLRAGIDEKTFVSLWAEGSSMKMEQAIEYALMEDIS